MLIDGFTVIAEIINFLILIFLLQRVLYKPLLKVMDAREQKIVAAQEEATMKQQEAEREAAQLRQARLTLEQQHEAALAQARADADSYLKERMESARQEATEAHEHWRADLAREQQAFLHDLGQRTAHEIVRISGRVIEQLAGADLERQAVQVFVRRIKQLEGDELNAMRRFAQTSGQAIQARSAFEMPPEARQQIVHVLREQLGEEIGVHFEVAPDLGFGIELKADGHKLAWNLKAYLQDLEDSVAAALEAQTQGARAAQP